MEKYALAVQRLLADMEGQRRRASVSLQLNVSVSAFQAPRDKLVCILNCCRVLNNVLQTSQSDGHEARGAFSVVQLPCSTHAP